ncbi:hypothetical protein ACIRD2_02770 [Streptomyces sp. NPDC093595]|jgi:hypothetical protein|uniref:hypothetical protein n=1 Tax=Streptomyces sp. NPDC093595 TaxID=3366045 RepID=UPI0038208E8A
MTVTVCNVCKTSGLPTQKYRIERVGATERVVDLCPDHAAPVEDVLARAAEPAADAEDTSAAPAPVRRRSSKRKVMTLEEIEELKAAQRKGAGQ